MRRIGLAVILTVSLVLAPLAAETQQAEKVHRIGLLGGNPPTSPEASHVWEGFFQGLRELGYVEGQNILIEGRFYGLVAKRATTTIPIVVATAADFVGAGLVASLARPGGNVTGTSDQTGEVRRDLAIKSTLERLGSAAQEILRAPIASSSRLRCVPMTLLACACASVSPGICTSSTPRSLKREM
jgi:hypothetical protein